MDSKGKLLLQSNLSTDLCTLIKCSFCSWDSGFFLNFCKKNILRRYKVSVLLYKMSLNRPLSPHLSIHKKVLTAVFSIFHRFTGFWLSLGAILLSVWIILIALGPSFYAKFQTFSSLIFLKYFYFFGVLRFSIIFIMELGICFGVLVKWWNWALFIKAVTS